MATPSGCETLSRRVGAKEVDLFVLRAFGEGEAALESVGVSPGVMGIRVVKNNMGNVPARQMNAQHCRTPGTSHPATVYFKA